MSVKDDFIDHNENHEMPVFAHELVEGWTSDGKWFDVREATTIPWCGPNPVKQYRTISIGTLIERFRDMQRNLEQKDEALKPFSDFADALNEKVPDEIAIGIYADGAMRFGPSGGANVGSLRAARKAKG